MQKKFVLALTWMLLLPLVPIGSMGASASPSTTIFVDPPEITTPPSENFTVNINIDNVIDLFAWQIKLKWNPQILDFADATEGDFLKTGGSTIWGYDVNETEGWIFVRARFADILAFPRVSGNGTLSKITFHGASLGECDVELYHTWLIAATPAPAPGETYGDFNGDSIVDIVDAGIVNAAWGTSEGDPRYNPIADANNDGFVDLLDLTYVVFNWENVYPDDDASKPVEISHEVSDGHVTIAREIHVPEDYPTIQEAIDAAEPGDTIVIAPGVYREQLVIDKNLTLLGQKGSQTTFDGGGSGIAVTLLPGAAGSTITGIVITNWDQGVLVNSNDCNIYDNIFVANVIAINLTAASAGNAVYDNIISSSTVAIELESGGNTIYGNIISENEVGIDVSNSSDSLIYCNNFINNMENVECTGSFDVWDNDYPSGGNYWSDHNPPDADLDRIGDVPYTVDEHNTDRYPLIYPYGFVPKPDVNDDGIINIKDLFRVARVFGTIPGEPNWNPIADVEMDEAIGIKDLYTVARDYGKTV